MSLKMFQRIIEEATSYKEFGSLSFMGRGESCLHPRFSEFIRIAKKHGVPHIHVTTNGNYNKSVIDDIIKAGVTHLRISLDAATEQVYKIVRQGGNFFQAHENALYMCRFADKVKLAVSFVRQDANESDLNQFQN